MTLTELKNRFNHHPPKGDQEQRYQVLRQATLALARQVLGLTPPSPEQTEALNLLDTVLMKANAAIARNEAWTKTDAWQLVDASPGCAIHAGALDGSGGERDREQTQQEAQLRKRATELGAMLKEPESPMMGSANANRLSLDEPDTRYAGQQGQQLPSRGPSPITTRYS
jgi:hypothetical protein